MANETVVQQLHLPFVASYEWCEKFFSFLTGFFLRMMSYFRTSEEPQYRVTRMFIYPIKSCAFIEIDKSWIIEPTGLQYDRKWMIVNKRGAMLSQLKEPRMCLIQPKLNFETGNLELRFPDFDEICYVPLNPPETDKYDFLEVSEDLRKAKVYNDSVTVRDCGDHVASWLENVLMTDDVRLVRHVDRYFKKGPEKLPLTLTDACQYLLVNETTIRWLREKLLAQDVDLTEESLIHRFRCNFLISPTPEPLEEFKWTQLQIGNAKFKVDRPCTRCAKINIDQQTAEKSYGEPFAILSNELNGKVEFGIYMRLVEASSFKKTAVCINDVVKNIKL